MTNLKRLCINATANDIATSSTSESGVSASPPGESPSSKTHLSEPGFCESPFRETHFGEPRSSESPFSDKHLCEPSFAESPFGESSFSELPTHEIHIVDGLYRAQWRIAGTPKNAIIVQDENNNSDSIDKTPGQSEPHNIESKPTLLTDGKRWNSDTWRSSIAESIAIHLFVLLLLCLFVSAGVMSPKLVEVADIELQTDSIKAETAATTSQWKADEQQITRATTNMRTINRDQQFQPRKKRHAPILHRNTSSQQSRNESQHQTGRQGPGPASTAGQRTRIHAPSQDLTAANPWPIALTMLRHETLPPSDKNSTSSPSNTPATAESPAQTSRSKVSSGGANNAQIDTPHTPANHQAIATQVPATPPSSFVPMMQNHRATTPHEPHDSAPAVETTDVGSPGSGKEDAHWSQILARSTFNIVCGVPNKDFPYPFASETFLARFEKGQLHVDRTQPANGHDSYGVCQMPGTDRYFLWCNHRLLQKLGSNGKWTEVHVSPMATRKFSGDDALSWSCGMTWDTHRNRLVIVTLSGEGFLLAFDPSGDSSGKFQLLADMKNHDFAGLAYSETEDCYYALETDPTYGGSLRDRARSSVCQISPNGHIRKTIQLSKGVDAGQCFPAQCFIKGRYMFCFADHREVPGTGLFIIDLSTGGVEWDEPLPM